MAEFLGGIQSRIENSNSWVNTPCMQESILELRRSSKEFEFERVGDTELWQVSSLPELAARLTYISFASTIATPLMILATLVEGVIRTAFGAGCFLLGQLRFEDSDTLARLGETLLKSNLKVGELFIDHVVTFFCIPYFLIKFTVQFLRDTGFGTKNMVIETPFLDKVHYNSSMSRGHWIHRPFMRSASDKFENFLLSIDIKSERGGWGVSSPIDFSLRVTILSLSAVTVNPLLMSAHLVEGVLRAVFGSLAYLLASIPFEGNRTLADLGWKMIRSTRTCGILAVNHVVLAVLIPFEAMKETGLYLWETAFPKRTQRTSH